MSSSTLNEIKAPIKDELKAFEPYFRQSMKTKIPLLNIVTRYILKRKGKQLRPILVFLTAKMLGNGKTNERAFVAAALIELLHTATLVHDDVVDNSAYRRGFFSVSALWKSKIAVLVGDYLLSKGLLLAVDNKEYEMLEITSQAVREMAEGELLQIEKARKLDITEEVYFDIIKKKTASLLAACTAIGAKAADADAEKVAEMKQFGEYAGLAFQIKDDLFDYETGSKTGKPKGNDIQEKKMTLPLIYALQKAEKKERKRILRILKRNANKPERINEVIEFVKEKKGIEYAQAKMFLFKKQAQSIIKKQEFTKENDSLLKILDFIVSRSM